ncbi:MAG: ABC transporter permease, partial [Bacteroidetes bacterium]|nr:ABC transporter permease [Bacteroidota bacterium]
GFTPERKPDVKELPSKTFQIPGWFRQVLIFIHRDLLSKISNLQYMAINLLESPLLALILVVIIRYNSGEGNSYIFRENENIPPFLFMSILVSLFVGLSVSAEEIFRDRHILKREAFLNLSRSSYLLSKIIILFFISAIQTLTFVLIGNSFLGIEGLYLEYWLILLGVSFFSNILGLNISSAFNSAVTIYILIPLLVIPQMILGGAMFSFDKLNSGIGGGKIHSPVIADVMVSRWAYEGLAVKQFKKNEYGSCFYEVDRIESMANYKQAFYLPELQRIIRETRELTTHDSDSTRQILAGNLALLREEISSELHLIPTIHFEHVDKLVPGSVGPGLLDQTEAYLNRLDETYIGLFNRVNQMREEIILGLNTPGNQGENYQEKYNSHYNEFLADIVKKSRVSDKIFREHNRLVQVIDPVYLYPAPGSFTFRAHFFAPVKYLAGKQVDTYWFNLIVILVFSLILYITLYFDLLRRILNIRLFS